ncbi:putative peptidoglycan lipid II flippase [Pricia antarctica]|uniref:Putative peptidoglycan lipid II flippase n=1 Tax=Pricia antarctica TaxID=641691 RepID=A0A1G7FKR5_9FLAO|nr:lipid II flippase MurJ [Pricia antarctica]SDE76498.1 putative peptidoglycan lipid II flippase [Pricia antarctica]
MIPNKVLETFNRLSKNKVIQNLVLVSGITFLIKGLGFYKETMVAATFGLSELLDTFYIAILVPTLISNIFLGAYRSVFVPNYIAEMKIKGDKGSFQATSFLITVVVSFLFMGIAYLSTDTFLEELYPGHPSSYYTSVKQQFYVLLPCVIFWGLASLIGGLLNIADEYRLSTIGGIFTPLAIICCLIFFKDAFGNQVLAAGTVFGAFATLLYLLLVALSKKILFFGIPDFQNSNIKILFSQLPAKVSSSLLSGLNTMVDQFFAAQLVVGSIAALNYGLKIPAFLTGLLVIAFTNVLLPHFSRSILENRKKTFESLFKTLKIVFVSVAVLVLIGVLISHDLVAFLFERKEFDSEDTLVVARIQQIFLIYLPFSISGMIMVNFLTSINKNAVLAYISLIALVLNIILDYIFMQYYGILGIAICTTIVSILKSTTAAYYIFRLKLKEFG